MGGFNKGSYYDYELAVPLEIIIELFPRLIRFDKLLDRPTKLATYMGAAE